MDTKISIKNFAGGYKSEVTNGRHTLVADEPLDLGGTDVGMSPVDLVLAGLAECKVVTTRAKAEKMGLDLGEIRADLSITTGKGEGRSLASKITIALTWDNEVSDEDRESILASAGRCYVHRLLQGSFEIETI